MRKKERKNWSIEKKKSLLDVPTKDFLFAYL